MRPETIDEYTELNDRILARHRVSRRAALRAALTGGGLVYAQYRLAGAAFAAGGGRAGRAGVVVSGRHLSFVPGADGVPRRAMAVTAQLVSSTGKLPTGLRAIVEVGTAPGGYGATFPAEIRHLTGSDAIIGGPVCSQFYVKAVMDRLTPGAVHHYRIRLSDGTVTGDAHFTAAPGPAAARFSAGYGTVAAPFTFTAFADVGTHTAPTDPRHSWHQQPAVVRRAGGAWPAAVFDNNSYLSTDPVAGAGGADPWPAVTQVDLMRTQNPVFALLAGDICYANPSGQGLPADDSMAMSRTAPTGKNLFNPYVWDVFLNQIEPLAAFVPWMFTTGNHDMEPIHGDHGYGGHLARLDLPGNGPQGCPSAYRFVYGNVGFLAIDANDLCAELQTNTGYSGGRQVRWVESVLREWRSGTTVDFIVAFFHQCAYSTSDKHASDGGVRDALDPLFSKYRVDLAIQGHNHQLERTDPIRFGRRTRSAPDGSTIRPADDGVTYICAGAGGRPRYPFRPAPGPEAPAPPGVKPSGAHTLPEGERYRGYRPRNPENNTESVDNSYVWSGATTVIGKSGQKAGVRVPEAIDWSQVRYDAYAFLAVDVVPAAPGGTTTLTVRTLADALPGTKQPCTEIDRITLARIAGRGMVTVAH
ncbi:metallophosphoesterase family protein [Actinoplanes hulinensis]|uniref:Metallophosphoesterase family protein n=1 Tax=Actinoplanes hulinensis TaxID=1144547 RepID=A0ABS7B1F5_9ACTN|nr:metallophosphoesterase family protein [Actinoplanes hulinensis]MBW6434244.1 metallophosphoesterase family protein [Actinoplanes hulinensis]